MLGNSKPHNPLYNSSLHFIFHFLFHFWGVISLYIPTLPPNFRSHVRYKPANLGGTWTPKVCKIMAFMAITMGLGLLFYILLGFRYLSS